MFRDKLTLVPTNPGCYLMKNSEGLIIYVGKAKNLKNRLNSYFHGTHSGKTAKLVSEICDFDYIVVSSETEALILELNLIKKYDPKYNILLRDDKSYPYIELSDDKVPKLSVVRNVNLKKHKNKLYGPYPNVTAARSTVNLLNRIYPLRKCKTYQKKPCLYFHINQCLGYCTNNIEPEKIQMMKAEIVKFLNGDNSIVTKKLKEEMYKESELLHFEKAKELKELLDYIDVVLEKQKVQISDHIDRDVFGCYYDRGYLSIVVMFIRGDKLIGTHSKIMPLIDELESEFSSYIAKFYEKDILKPKEILVTNIETKVLEDYLNITVKVPIKGEKKALVEMANMNAQINLNEQFELIKRDEEKTVDANDELKRILNIPKLDRIEIFDNSNLFGSFNVSGMVVFIDGKPAKNEYRKYKISIDKNDDYGTMKEVLYRRYFKVLKENLVKPDLIIVDGGIGQINVALEIINSLGLDIKIVGLKKDDKHITNALIDSDLNEIKIDKKSNLFHYLTIMQDEVHEFTINYHKKIRSKGNLESVLDNVSGIGDIRKNQLLKKYKSLTKLKELTLEELQEDLPEKAAENLYNFLKDK